MKRLNFLKLCILFLFLSGCAHSYIGTRKASYCERWKKALSAQVAEDLGPGYSATMTEGSDNGVDLSATHIVIGTYSKKGNWVTDFAFYMGGYNTLHYSFSYSGPTNGETSRSFHFNGLGMDLVWGYQLGLFRPYFGLKRETFNDPFYMSPDLNIQSLSFTILFIQAGLAYEVPITKSINITLQADYAEAIEKQSVISEANMISGQAVLKWGWK